MRTFSISNKCLHPKGSQCNYAERYVLVTQDSPINWHDAELICQTTFDTNLASIHSKSDHSESEKICQSKHSRETCWIGLHDNKNEATFIWSDGTHNNIDFWGDWEPTSNFNGDLGEKEDCVHLAPFKNNRWNDLDCSGDVNNIQIKSFLCQSPSYDNSQGCACNCDICQIYGDPHFDTFDGLKHHYQGKCAYSYVTPCDGDRSKIPFEIVGIHKPCLNGQSCMTDINVKLFDSDGIVLENIILSQNKIAIYNDDKETVVMNKAIKYINGNDDAFFYIEMIDEYLQMSIYTGKTMNNQALADVIVRITDGHGAFGSATIHITECWLGKVCGLCGKYDHNPSNDLRLPLNNAVEEYLSIDNIQRAVNMDDDSWKRTNQFGDSWLDDSVPSISDKCSPEIVVKADCISSETTQTLCTTAYEQDCDALCSGNPDVFTEVWDSCLFDACAACNIDAMTKECIQPLIIYCDAKCNEPILPTYQPTVTPTTRKPTIETTKNPTPNPTTGTPTLNPTQKPSKWPTQKPTPTPINDPTAAPTFTPTDFPSWTPTPKPTKRPTKKPSAAPTSKPTDSPTYASCTWDFEVDIIFIVDTGCGSDEQQQEYQQEFLTNLIQSIKQTPNPKISVVECNSFKVLTPLLLSDDKYNNMHSPPSNTDLSDLYDKFNNRREYVPGDKTPKKKCFQKAIKEFDDNNFGHIREKKIVLISSCVEDDSEGSVCELEDDDSMDDIDVIIVNIGSEQNAFECLINSDMSRIYTYDTFGQLENTDDQLYAIRAEICEQPTDDPTPSPTPEPSNDPSTKPTRSPLYRPCAWSFASDIIIIVDASCGINDDEEELQQEYVSNIVQLIKKNANPRVGIIECGNQYIHNQDMVVLPLDDDLFNNLTEDPFYSEMKDLYVSIADRREYSKDFTTTPKIRCLNQAMDEFGDSTRHKKIILLSNCIHYSNSNDDNVDVDAVCSFKDELYSEKDNIEVIIINIGTDLQYGIKSDTYQCLNDDFNKLFVYEDFDLLNKNENALFSVRDEICQLPTRAPSNKPTHKPTRAPTEGPTSSPTQPPTDKPTRLPTKEPTRKPTNKPSKFPTKLPTNKPSIKPTDGPTESPTDSPIFSPTHFPTFPPTKRPTSKPTRSPTESPTEAPIQRPTHSPTNKPTKTPTPKPSHGPTESPTPSPTKRPTHKPTDGPTQSPTDSPSFTPTDFPTFSPTGSPTNAPTDRPTQQPTKRPTKRPTRKPSRSPTDTPTDGPTNAPTHGPTPPPTKSPTTAPTYSPSDFPTFSPSEGPSPAPTTAPSYSSCGNDFKVNLVFAVDRSCELEKSACKTQNEFISDLFEKTKDDFSPRISYIEYADNAETVFNFSSKLNQNMDDFVTYIRSMKCDVISQKITKPASAIQTAINLFDVFDSDSNDDDLMINKPSNLFIMLNNCDNYNGDINNNVCSLVPELKQRNIEVLLINAHNVECIEYNCLVRKPVHQHIFCVDNLVRNEFLEIIDGVEREICTKPTPSPTQSPTNTPTFTPTFEPTHMPTMKIWEKVPWFPIKEIPCSSSSSSSSSSDSPCSSSSSSSSSSPCSSSSGSSKPRPYIFNEVNRDRERMWNNQHNDD